MVEKIKLVIWIFLFMAGAGFLIVYINREMTFYQLLATPLNW